MYMPLQQLLQGTTHLTSPHCGAYAAAAGTAACCKAMRTALP